MSDFAINIREWCERTKANLDLACRSITLELSTRIVLKSPVGNPELWAANADAALAREQHNMVVDQIVANLKSDARNLTAKGNLKRSVRSAQSKRLSKAQLARTYPLKAGKGYAGGRFRGNWIVSVGTASSAPIERIDPSGQLAIEAASAALATFNAGPSIYITNSLPYAVRIEEGWSRQAPQGVVKTTVLEFKAIVRDAIAKLPGAHAP